VLSNLNAVRNSEILLSFGLLRLHQFRSPLN